MTSQNTDEVKGRVKEAIGALTGNDDLKSNGKRDRAAASAKQAVDKVRERVGEGIDAVKDRLSKD